MKLVSVVFLIALIAIGGCRKSAEDILRDYQQEKQNTSQVETTRPALDINLSKDDCFVFALSSDVIFEGSALGRPLNDGDQLSFGCYVSPVITVVPLSPPSISASWITFRSVAFTGLESGCQYGAVLSVRGPASIKERRCGDIVEDISQYDLCARYEPSVLNQDAVTTITKCFAQ